MQKALQKIIDANPGKKLSIQGFFSNYPLEEYFILKKSAILFGRSDRLWAHLAGPSGSDMETLLDKHHHKTNYFHAVEDRLIPLLKKFGKIDWQLSTKLFIREGVSPPTPPLSRVLPLTPSYAEYIHQNSAYNEYTSAAYISDRLGRDISAGIFENGQLVAWALTHDDGSLGFMNVLKDHRKKGYARDIAAAMARMKMEKKEPVFANIEADNLPALKLAEQFGFEQRGSSSWVKMIW